MPYIFIQFHDVAFIPLLIAGILFCYLGYKIFKALLGVMGFFLGFTAGSIIFEFMGWDISFGINFGIIFSIVLGIILAIMAVKIYYAGVFLYSGAVGFSVVYLLLGSLLFALPAGIVIGIIAVALIRHALIIFSAVGGGLLIGTALSLLFSGFNDSILLAISAIFAATGIYVQYRFNKQPETQVKTTGENPPITTASAPDNNVEGGN